MQRHKFTCVWSSTARSYTWCSRQDGPGRIEYHPEHLQSNPTHQRDSCTWVSWVIYVLVSNCKSRLVLDRWSQWWHGETHGMGRVERIVWLFVLSIAHWRVMTRRVAIDSSILPWDTIDRQFYRSFSLLHSTSHTNRSIYNCVSLLSN